MLKKTLLTLFILLAFVPGVVSADDNQGTWKARVVEVLGERTEEIFDVSYFIQDIEIEFLNGPQEGQVVQIENDLQELEEGDKIYVSQNTSIEGESEFNVANVFRQGPLIILFLVFIFAVILFGGWQGVRSLVALGFSFLAIIYVLIPGILNGWNPLIGSFIVAAAVLFAAIFFTHGFNRESAVAYSGTMISVILTGLFSVLAVSMTKLSGFAADEAVFLNFNTGGDINFTALLLGAFIIGFLGVLDDIAVTQAAVVTELFDSNKEMSKKEAYKRAMRVGREHVGALVNTLVLAYTGASLPLLLYFYLLPNTFVDTLNLEIFATEIVRIIVGSIGLILTVPIVTLLAVNYLRGYKSKHSHHHGHHHGHSH